MTGVAVLDFSSVSNPDLIFSFPVEPSLQQVVINVFFVSLDTVAFLSSHVGCDSVASHAVGDALDAGLEVQTVFRGKLRGHSQIAQSTLCSFSRSIIAERRSDCSC